MIFRALEGKIHGVKNKRVTGKNILINKAQVKKFFANRAEKYNPAQPEVSMLYRDKDPKSAKKMAQAEKKAMLPLISAQKDDHVLDVGCGIGRWAEVLAPKVKTYHGTDMVEDLIKIAKKRCASLSNTSFQTIAAEDISETKLSHIKTKSFNKIIIAGVLHYINDTLVKKVLKNVGSLCAANGRIVIRGPVATDVRLTLDGIWSEELEYTYSSIYRTREEFIRFFQECLPDFVLVEDRPLFAEELNNYANKQQYVFVLEPKKKIRTAFCFDLDGTITKDEILPVLSEKIGLYQEIEALTAATINGVIPFEKSFLLRTRLLSEIPISQVQKIVSKIRLHQRIVDFIKKNKKDSFVITGNLDVWMEPMKKKLDCGFYSSEAKYKGDKLLGVSHVLEKSEAIADLRQHFDRIIVVGDGMGDVRMFESADISIAFGGVHKPIETLLKLSNYVVYNETSLCRLLHTLS